MKAINMRSQSMQPHRSVAIVRILCSGWGEDLPATWEDLLALARRGLITVPAIAIDSLMNFFMLVNALDAEPFTLADQVVAQEQGVLALELLRELVQLSAPGSLERNPIRTWQLLADSDTPLPAGEG
jgi:multiple sugar transport system substrate-binding protein